MSRVRVLCLSVGVAVTAACSDGTGPSRPVVWTSLTAGYEYTCGVTNTGTAYCWGDNYYGQFGNGSADSLSPVHEHPAPVAVSGGLAFAYVTSAVEHACGLTRNGAAYCWGYNFDGELGNGSTVSSPHPEAVAGGLTFTSVTTGGAHTCGVTSTGAAYCWGANSYGELGDSSRTQRNTPVAVSGGLTFVSLTVGLYHTCGLTSGGAAYCWGAGSGLGDGQSHGFCYGYNGAGECSLTPVAVAGGLAFASLTSGDGHTCGLTTAGAAYCWGATPTVVAAGLSFAGLAAGLAHTCGVTGSGAAYCWGFNNSGQLGDGSTTQSLTPVAVSGGLTFVSLTVGSYHTCGLTSSGAAYCWGRNFAGQLGDGSTTNRFAPVAVVNP